MSRLRFRERRRDVVAEDPTDREDGERGQRRRQQHRPVPGAAQHPEHLDQRAGLRGERVDPDLRRPDPRRLLLGYEHDGNPVSLAVRGRTVLIAGEPVPYALARIPKPGETRGNLAAGGTGVARLLTARDREIAETLGPPLFRQGLLLVGLDVIGDYLTEINVTSPTCFQEIMQQTGCNVAGMMVDALESLVANAS